MRTPAQALSLTAPQRTNSNRWFGVPRRPNAWSVARLTPRKRHTELLAFLHQLGRAVPRRREMHLILDN